jgi:hypothetical protein
MWPIKIKDHPEANVQTKLSMPNSLMREPSHEYLTSMVWLLPKFALDR